MHGYDRDIFICGYGAVAPGSPEREPAPNAANSQGERVAIQRVRDFGADDLIDQATLRRMDRFTQMSVVASELAMRNAGMTPQPANAERVGIAFNSCFGPLTSAERYSTKLLLDGGRKAPAGLFPFTALNVFTGLVTMRLKVLGSNSTMCASSSVTYAINAIRQCTDDVVLAGGVEELTDSMVRALTPKDLGKQKDRAPFRPAASDVALSEGSAVVVLRGGDAPGAVPPGALAQLHGFGQASNHADETPFSMPYETIRDAMQEAIDSSGIRAEQIDLFFCGANSFGDLEEKELQAAREIFPEAHRPRAFNTKFRTGESLGAAEIFAISETASILAGQKAPEDIELAASRWHPTWTPCAYRYAIFNAIEYGGVITSYVLSTTETIN